MSNHTATGPRETGEIRFSGVSPPFCQRGLSWPRLVRACQWTLSQRLDDKCHPRARSRCYGPENVQRQPIARKTKHLGENTKHIVNVLLRSMTRIRSLKPNVTREQAIQQFSPHGPTALFRLSLIHI